MQYNTLPDILHFRSYKIQYCTVNKTFTNN